MAKTPTEVKKQTCMLLLIATMLSEISKPTLVDDDQPDVGCVSLACAHWVWTSSHKKDGRCGLVNLRPSIKVS